MKPLSILHIGWAHSIHVERLMRWFADRGHTNSILTNFPKEIKGINVFDICSKNDNRSRLRRYKELSLNIGWKWVRSLDAIVKIRKLVKEISPDIIHSHSLWYPGYLGVYIKGYPFVVTVLNGDVLWKKNDISFYGKLRTRWGLKKADLITGESNELIMACIKHGADKKKVHVTRGWGVDLNVFNGGKDKLLLREKLNLPGNVKIVLSPRTIDSLYNLKTLIEIIPKVLKRINNTVFVFIGHHVNEEYLKELKQEVMKLKIKDNVIFIGKVDYTNVALYHQSSDVFVSVSPKDSGPVALQEAMACCNAPVISDLPSVRELINNGHNGLLIDPFNSDQIANSIIKLLQDDELRESFTQRNLEIVREKCDQEKEMKKMEKLYYQLIS